MENLYQPGPKSVPETLTQATNSYKRHAWLALGGIFLFVLTYVGLSGWFVYTAYRLFNSAIVDDAGIVAVLLGILNAFLAMFMLKALFIKNEQQPNIDVELSPKEEPQLFQYLYQLADEIKAPRPHRVFINHYVNAGVFYDLSIFNLIWPSKKNLSIGLGLINVLTLGEFKAVLAHEFGHFAQRSMLIGRWVYTAQKIAVLIVAKRDKIDDFLYGLSYSDLRFAWIGWILSLLVWSIRSVIEAFFNLVVMAERALSREMEFQADLVAVSATGSDALIHALYRTRIAEEALNQALTTAGIALDQQQAITDVYALQDAAIQQLKKVYNEAEYGDSPSIPDEKREEFRVFKSKIAHPPKMWATHPLDFEREANAKNTYIYCLIDDRSAWELFQQPQAVKEKMTAELFKEQTEDVTLLTTPLAIEEQDKRFNKEYFNPSYQGIYLDRPLAITYETAEEMYALEVTRLASLPERLAELYPASLRDTLDKFQALEEEYSLLEGIRQKVLDAASNAITYRGRRIKRKELPAATEEVKRELQVVEKELLQHDRACRNTFLSAAKKLGGNWEKYLIGLMETIHYAEHTDADVRDSFHALQYTFGRVTANGKVNSDEMSKLLLTANSVYHTLKRIYEHSVEVQLDEFLLKKLEIESWEASLGEFKLVRATETNLNQWLDVIESWVDTVTSSLAALRSTALERLLQVEKELAKWIQDEEHELFDTMTSISSFPEKYRLLLWGEGRKYEDKPNVWERFQQADGMLPAIARFTVAASIVGATIWFNADVGRPILTIYNGLATDVVVTVEGQEVALQPFGHDEITLAINGRLTISTRTDESQLIEHFSPPEFLIGGRHYVYNVAKVGLLNEEDVYYGEESAPNYSNLIGFQQWMATAAEYRFEELPKQVYTSDEGVIKTSLQAFSEFHPSIYINFTTSEEEAKHVVLASARWNDMTFPYTLTWLELASSYLEFNELLDARLFETPSNIHLLRWKQQEVAGTEQEEAFYDQLANNTTITKSDRFYLATKRLAKEKQDDAFLEGYQKYPTHTWLAFAASHILVKRGDYNAALQAIKSIDSDPAMKIVVANDKERMLHLALGVSTMSRSLEYAPYITYLSRLEQGVEEMKESSLFAYSLLFDGELTKTLGWVQNDSLKDEILRVVAVSDGTNEKIREQALALSVDQGINQHTIWMAIALRAKYGKSLTGYWEKHETLIQDVPFTQAFIALIQAGKLKEAEEKIRNTHFYLKAKHYLLATILLGKKTPKEWKRFAKLVLFITERPYWK